jgi:malonyl CoA-acyl carrier protein transacylase
MTSDSTPFGAVLTEVAAERRRQDERWGEQNHPDGSGPLFAAEAAQARKECDEAAENGELSWRHILLEEVAEAMAEQDADLLRRELIQVAAVAVAWAEAIDRRANG